MRKRPIHDKRVRRLCIVCGKQLKKTQKRYMIAIDGRTVPVNFYIHRRCNDNRKIRKALENEEKYSKVINFEV